jgi:predicted nucleic acid-binding protein
VLDAGPLIALIHGSDAYHAVAARGFEQLTTARARLVAPLPIVFEVYKWLLYEAGPQVARTGLRHMRDGLEIVAVEAADFEDAVAIVEAMPGWLGTLEDALVAAVCLRSGWPLWTLNFRDLSAFDGLPFWTPG